MNTYTAFENMARAAAAAPVVTWRVDYRQPDGTLEPVGDTHATHAAAYDDYADSHKFWPHADLVVWALHDDGMAEDVTAEFEYEMQNIEEQRGLSSSDAEQSEADFQRSVAYCSGHFS